jgi:hypothetical protein
MRSAATASCARPSSSDAGPQLQRAKRHLPLDCTPRRAATASSTRSELPATAKLIPGRGSASIDCGLEWAYDSPVLDRRGIPSHKQTCKDGDPACDKGSTSGECTFYVWVCANNTDPQLPTCAPGPSGIGNITSVETRKPSTREAGLRPVDAANRQQLLTAATAAQTTAQNFCGPRIAVRVPLKSPTVKGVKVFKLSGTTDKTLRDTDV